MAKDKSPSFQFYPDAWLSSKDILLMTPAEEGAYIRLLAIAWMEPDGGLPADDTSLSILSRLGPEWKRSSDRIRAKFDLSNGKLFNRRLLEERQKQQEWREKSSKGGTKGAKKRWSENDNQTITKDQPKLNQQHDQPVTKSEPHSQNGHSLVNDVVKECLQPNASPKHDSSSSSSSSVNTITRPPNFPPMNSLVADWFESRYLLHPRKGHRAAAMQACCEIPEIESGEGRERFNRSHDAWISCDDWRWKGGVKAPFFDEFVRDKTYDYEPPTEKTTETESDSRHVERNRKRVLM